METEQAYRIEGLTDPDPSVQRTIWKYPVAFGAHPQTIALPSESKLVHTSYSHENFWLWFEHAQSAATASPGQLAVAVPEVDIEFMVVGTGHPIAPGWQHVTTAIDHGYVWHLYHRVSDLA